MYYPAFDCRVLPPVKKKRKQVNNLVQVPTTGERGGEKKDKLFIILIIYSIIVNCLRLAGHGRHYYTCMYLFIIASLNNRTTV